MSEPRFDPFPASGPIEFRSGLACRIRRVHLRDQVAHQWGVAALAEHLPQLPPRSLFEVWIIFLVLAASIPLIKAQGGWPQWRGPDRNASLFATVDWPRRLERVWERDVGPGYSGPVTDGYQVWVHAREGDGEVVMCLDAKSGKVVWRQAYPVSFVQDPSGRQHGVGPYSTPSISDGRLFTLSIRTVLSVWRAEDGALLWRRDYSKEFPLEFAYFGAAASPLVWGGLCFVHFGGMNREQPEMPGEGAMIALRVSDGSEQWRWSGDAPALGASPVIAEIDGTEQLVFKSMGKIVSVNPRTGQELWQLPFKVDQDNTIVTPLVHNGILLTSDYRMGTVGWRIERDGAGWKISELWRNRRVSMFTSSPVIVGGILVGFAEERSGHVVGLDPVTGRSLWQGDPRWGEHASLVGWNSQLLVFREDGELVVGSVSDRAFEISQRVQLGFAGSWGHPALTQDKIFVRDGPRLIMFRLLP